MVGGGQPLLPEILGQLAPVGAKSQILNWYSLVALRIRLLTEGTRVHWHFHMPSALTHVHSPEILTKLRTPNYHTTWLYMQESLHFWGQTIWGQGKGPQKAKTFGEFHAQSPRSEWHTSTDTHTHAYRDHRRRKVSKSVWAMASAVAQAYNGGLPPEAEAFLAFWTSNGWNKFAPFAVFLVCSRFKEQTIEKPIGE